MKTILAIDFGRQRIGLARANAQARLVEPLMTISNNEQTLLRIESIVAQEQIGTIVIGLPRNLNGQETPQSLEVRQFAAEVEKRLQCPIVLQDETLSSVAADELKARFPKADTDSRAAAIILEDYLESL